MPIATAFASQELVIAHVASISDPNQKVQVIGNFTRNNLATFNFLRASSVTGNTFLVGTGACYESAMADSTLLKDAGFDARIIA